MPTTALAALLAALAVAISATAVALLPLSPLPTVTPTTGSPAASGSIVVAFLVVCSTALTGALIAARRPDHPIGWLYLAAGLLLAFAVFGVDEAVLERLGPPTAPGVEALAWLANGCFVPSLVILLGWLPLVYPTGRLLSPRWRWAILVGGADMLLSVVQGAFQPGPIPNAPTITNPLGIVGIDGLLERANTLGNVGAPIVLGASTACLLIRFRRARSVERQQLKWFLFALAVVAVLLSIGIALSTGTASDLAWMAAMAAMSFVPVATAIAILRYRLFDIDVIIRRTLLYTALTALLALSFAAGVLVLDEVLRPVTGSGDLPVAGSTLLVAALFQPLRGRLRAFIDRRFYRSRYDAQATVGEFAGALRTEVDLEAIGTSLVGVVESTIRPAQVALWLRRPA